MKSILISIKPKYVADILNHKKTIEVRKSMPKCDLPIDVYIYCTKDKGILGRILNIWTIFKPAKWVNKTYNGKVVAKFTLNKVEEYINGHKLENLKEYVGSCIDYEEVLKPSCLEDDELYAYANDLHFFAWHISNLVIFDKPKELSEFMVRRKINGCSGCKYLDTDTYEHCIKCEETKPLTKAPQSWYYVESEK